MAEWYDAPGLNVGLFLAFTQNKIDVLRSQRQCLLRSVLLKGIFEKAVELEQREPYAFILNDGAIEIFHPRSAAAAWNQPRPSSSTWSSALFGDLEDPFERDIEDLGLLPSQHGDDATQGSLSVDLSILRLLDERPEEAGPDRSDDAPTAPSDAAEADALQGDGQASSHSQQQSAVGDEHAEQPELPEQADMAPARAETPGAHSHELLPWTDETAEDSDEVALPDVSPGADADFGDSFGFGVPGDM